MKAKSFYIARSTELHAKLAEAHEAVKAVEQEINENIRLVNIAPVEDEIEGIPEPAPPIVKPVTRPAMKRPQ